MSLEERLRRLEEALQEVMTRLERLEERLGGESPETRAAVELALAFTLPAQKIVEAARLVARLAESLGDEVKGDPVSRAIIEALAVKGPMCLRELEREVRRLKGTASRATIRDRLERLEQMGVVKVEVKGKRWVISLAED